MSITEYKEAIKTLVDATDDEVLLRQWQEQLKRDVETQQQRRIYDEDYLQSLRKKARSWLGKIDANQWLQDVRGSYEG